MKKKSFLISVLISSLILGMTACGGSGSSAPQSSAAEASAEAETPAETAAPAETEPAAETAPAAEAEAAPAAEAETAPAAEAEAAPAAEAAPEEESGEIHIGFGYISSDTINRTILENMAEMLKEEGIVLELKECTDQDSANMYLSYPGTGIDMAFAVPGAEYDTSLLQPAGYTSCYHYHLYSTKYDSVEEIGEDDRIGLYLNHYQNDLRTQIILEAAGIISLPNGPSVPLNESDVELHVADISTGTDYHAIFANLKNLGAALMPGIVMSYDSIFEDPTFDDPQFWGTILVRSEDLKDPVLRDAYKKVVAAYQSDFTAMTLYQDSHAEPVGWNVVLIE